MESPLAQAKTTPSGGAVEVLYSVLGADSAGPPLTVRRDL